MSHNTSITKIIIGLFVIGVVGFFIGNLLSAPSSETVAMTEESADAADEAASVDAMTDEAEEMTNEMPSGDEATMDDTASTDTMTDTAAGTYTDYDPTLLANAETGEVLLYFHADWCPSCRGLEKDINESLGDIPSDVTILKLNYDTETDLKRQYGVVRQHTLVRVDSEGNKIETLTGLTNTLDQVLAQI